MARTPTSRDATPAKRRRKFVHRGWLSRDRTLAMSLIALTVLMFYVCYLIVLPFLPALAWSVALAVVARPLHVWIKQRIPQKQVAAALSVLLVALAIVVPVLFVIQQLTMQATTGFTAFRDYAAQLFERYPAVEQVLRHFVAGGSASEDEQTLSKVATSAPSFVGGSLWIGAQLLITFFMLFYFFRDRRDVVHEVERFLPLAPDEASRTLSRIENTIFATLYGSVLVAIIQGTLGGLMFWFLGLPTPLVWGTIMAVLATIPMLGTFVVWFPAVLFLAMEGSWGKAVILFAWGSIAIALIDNLLYPIVVGTRLQLHPLLVFIAVVGGVALFGTAGLVLGPVAVSVTEALIDVWRHRTAHGGTADGTTQPA